MLDNQLTYFTSEDNYPIVSFLIPSFRSSTCTLYECSDSFIYQSIMHHTSINVAENHKKRKSKTLLVFCKSTVFDSDRFFIILMMLVQESLSVFHYLLTSQRGYHFKLSEFYKWSALINSRWTPNNKLKFPRVWYSAWPSDAMQIDLLSSQERLEGTIPPD